MQVKWKRKLKKLLLRFWECFVAAGKAAESNLFIKAVVEIITAAIIWACFR